VSHVGDFTYIPFNFIVHFFGEDDVVVVAATEVVMQPTK
jgi:hypothetical protein